VPTIIDKSEAALGEDAAAEIAASFGPLVVLSCLDRADEAADRIAVGEDADPVGTEYLTAWRSVGLFEQIYDKNRSGDCANTRLFGASRARVESRCMCDVSKHRERYCHRISRIDTSGQPAHITKVHSEYSLHWRQSVMHSGHLRTLTRSGRFGYERHVA